MSTVLESIVEGVLEDLQKRIVPIRQLQERIDVAPQVRDAFAAIAKPGTQVIAEVKRASPSKGQLSEISDPVGLAQTYQEGGAAVVSVLTEERRFKGSIDDLVKVRAAIDLPVLRKDFIVTEFQVMETRAIGADLLLLIVASLSDSELRDFSQMAGELGLNVLIEIHDERELERALEISPKIIGVNSRNLKTLEVDPAAFTRLLPLIPSEIVKVAESGISTRQEVEIAELAGAGAILVGETLVKSGDPVRAIAQLAGR
jgi:indole-3-glycerol phosphate synthase